jgi:hypothetical protein
VRHFDARRALASAPNARWRRSGANRLAIGGPRSVGPRNEGRRGSGSWSGNFRGRGFRNGRSRGCGFGGCGSRRYRFGGHCRASGLAGAGAAFSSLPSVRSGIRCRIYGGRGMRWTGGQDRWSSRSEQGQRLGGEVPRGIRLLRFGRRGAIRPRVARGGNASVRTANRGSTRPHGTTLRSRRRRGSRQCRGGTSRPCGKRSPRGQQSARRRVPSGGRRGDHAPCGPDTGSGTECGWTQSSRRPRFSWHRHPVRSRRSTAFRRNVSRHALGHGGIRRGNSRHSARTAIPAHKHTAFPECHNASLVLADRSTAVPHASRYGDLVFFAEWSKAAPYTRLCQISNLRFQKFRQTFAFYNRSRC